MVVKDCWCFCWLVILSISVNVYGFGNIRFWYVYVVWLVMLVCWLILSRCVCRYWVVNVMLVCCMLMC